MRKILLSVIGYRFLGRFTFLLITIHCSLITLSAEILYPERIYPWKAWEGEGTTNQTIGVPGGIPNRTTIFVNLLTGIVTAGSVYHAEYDCAGDGVTDDTAKIQQALRDCPDNEVVYAPTAQYAIYGSISVPGAASHLPAKSNYTLRGDGPGLTVFLELQPSCGVGCGTTTLTTGTTNSPVDFKEISPAPLKGATSFTVTAAPTNYIEGDNALIIVTWATIRMAGDPIYVHHIGFSETYQHSMGFVVHIVDITGSTITFDPPCPLDLTGLDPVLSRFESRTTHGVALEDFSVDGTGHDAGWFWSAYNMRGSWMRNVVLVNGASRQLTWNAVIQSEIRRCEFRDLRAGGSSHEGVDLVGQCCWNLVEDNIFKKAGHGQLMLSDGASSYSCGNVVGYNHFNADVDTGGVAPDTTGMDVGLNHGAHPMFNLVEGNTMGMLQSDGYYGSASHNTVKGNWISVTHINQPTVGLGLRGVDLTHYTNYTNVIGNVIGTSAFTGVYDRSKYRNYSVNFPGGAGPHNTPTVIYRLGQPNLGNTCYGLHGTIYECSGPGVCGSEQVGDALDDCTDNTVEGCRNVLIASVPPAMPDYSDEPYLQGACGSVQGGQRLDLNVQHTTARHGNYVYKSDPTGPLAGDPGVEWEPDNDNVVDHTDHNVAAIPSLYTTQQALVERGVVMGAMEIPMIIAEPIGVWEQINIEMCSPAAYRFFNDGDDPPEGEPEPAVLYLFRN